MAILDNLQQAVENAVSAGANAARGQGEAIGADVEALVKPNLDAIVIQIAAIAQDRANDVIGDDQAKSDLQNQLGQVATVVQAVAELSALSAQIIANAVLGALKTAINAAVHVPLF